MYGDTVLNLGGLGLGGAFSGQSGMSDAWSLGGGQSTSTSNGYGYSDAESQQYSDAWSSGYGQSEAWNQGENWSNNSSYGAVYGSEASAKDIENALNANLWQDYFQKQSQQFNKTEAEKARAYETLMSNTSYQRAVADLRKAGLNPILAAYNMGASTPIAAVASSGMGNANKATAYADQRSGSSGSSYGYNKGGSYSYNKSSSESHSKGYSKSHSYNKESSSSSSWNNQVSKSHSQTSNNLKDALKGLGDFFNGLSSAQKTGEYPGDEKGTGKGWDGYDMPTVSN